MNQDAAVTRVRFARGPGFFTPFEFRDQFVIGEVGFGGCEVAVMLAADAQHAVGQSENSIRISIFSEIFQERIERSAIVATEQMDYFPVLFGG